MVDSSEPPHLDPPINPPQNLNVAKVTIETPNGTSTKYYMLYRDQCFSLGSLAVGAGGSIGVGFYSRIFFEQLRPKPKKFWKKMIPFSIPEVRMQMKLNGKLLSVPILFGNTVWWRVGSQGLLGAGLYTYLQCKLQGTWYRRSYFDCGTAGAITGAVFGFRGYPGNLQGSAIGAAGFGTFALICRFIFL